MMQVRYSVVVLDEHAAQGDILESATVAGEELKARVAERLESWLQAAEADAGAAPPTVEINVERVSG